MATSAFSVDIKQFEEFIKPIIKPNSTVLRYETKPLIGEGENYGSLLVSVEISIQNEDKTTETLSAVAKMCPLNNWLKRMFASHITFKKEIGFYRDLVPALIDFQRDHKVPEDKWMNFFPRCLNARLSLNATSDIIDDDAVLLLENLKLNGYSLVNRLHGLNYKEAVVVLKNLARFHAVPLAYKIQKPIEFQTKFKPLLNRILIGEEISDLASDRFCESLYRHLNLTDDELKRFLNGMNKGFDFQKTFPSGNDKYATIVHCDFWINNTMIQYENNEPIGNKMLDFQVNTYGSPACDLVFFLYTSIAIDILQKHYDNLVRIYHDEFVQCLRELHCDTGDYTFASFQKEVDLYGSLEASHILIMFRAVFKVPTKTTKKIEDLSMDDMFTDDGITDIFKDRLKYTVDEFFNKKWF